MTERIQRREYRLGTSDGHDPDKIDELQTRREKHERLTRGKPKRSFGEVLADRLRDKPEDDEQEEEQEEEQQGAKDPLLGLDPNQKPSIANPSGDRRSGRVIIKG